MAQTVGMKVVAVIEEAGSDVKMAACYRVELSDGRKYRLKIDSDNNGSLLRDMGVNKAPFYVQQNESARLFLAVVAQQGSYTVERLA